MQISLAYICYEFSTNTTDQKKEREEGKGRGVFSIKIEHLYTAPPNVFSRYCPHAQA